MGKGWYVASREQQYGPFKTQNDALKFAAWLDHPQGVYTWEVS